MKLKFGLFLLLLLTALPVTAGTTPDFSFTDLEGKIYASAVLKGTPLIIYLGKTS